MAASVWPLAYWPLSKSALYLPWLQGPMVHWQIAFAAYRWCNSQVALELEKQQPRGNILILSLKVVLFAYCLKSKLYISKLQKLYFRLYYLKWGFHKNYFIHLHKIITQSIQQEFFLEWQCSSHTLISAPFSSRNSRISSCPQSAA